MRFLIDAQLPRQSVDWFVVAGCDAVHTQTLANGNRTTDAEIIATADRDQRAVVTKDADFVNSHLLHERPARLLLVSTGNLSNAELQALLVPLIPSIVLEFQTSSSNR